MVDLLMEIFIFCCFTCMSKSTLFGWELFCMSLTFFGNVSLSRRRKKTQKNIGTRIGKFLTTQFLVANLLEISLEKASLNEIIWIEFKYYNNNKNYIFVKYFGWGFLHASFSPYFCCTSQNSCWQTDDQDLLPNQRVDDNPNISSFLFEISIANFSD